MTELFSADDGGPGAAGPDRRGERITPPPVSVDAETAPEGLSGELRASDPETELADLVIRVLNARTDIGTIPVPGLKDAEMLGTCSVIELSGDFEWGVDRGAVFSLHEDAADATEVFSRCLANGVRARLLRRTVGPWTSVTE